MEGIDRRGMYLVLHRERTGVNSQFATVFNDQRSAARTLGPEDVFFTSHRVAAETAKRLSEAFPNLQYFVVRIEGSAEPKPQVSYEYTGYIRD